MLEIRSIFLVWIGVETPQPPAFAIFDPARLPMSEENSNYVWEDREIRFDSPLG